MLFRADSNAKFQLLRNGKAPRCNSNGLNDERWIQSFMFAYLSYLYEVSVVELASSPRCEMGGLRWTSDASGLIRRLCLMHFDPFVVAFTSRLEKSLKYETFEDTMNDEADPRFSVWNTWTEIYITNISRFNKKQIKLYIQPSRKNERFTPDSVDPHTNANVFYCSFFDKSPPRKATSPKFINTTRQSQKREYYQFHTRKKFERNNP